MSTYRITVIVDVDDELLVSHDGKQAPPPNDVAEWYGGDLVEAVNSGIAEIEHDQLDVELVAEVDR